MSVNRRQALLLSGATLLSGRAVWPELSVAASTMLTRKIPSSGEAIPVIGLGTSGALDVGDSAEERAAVEQVLRAFFAGGATLIDTAPSYRRAEGVVGDLVAKIKPARSFLATKVSARGKDAGLEQIRHSFEVLRRPVIDLMQIHSLNDWQTHSATLREMKSGGKFRYIGITHSSTSAHADLETVLRAEKWDWVQLNYSIETRAAENRLLPLAEEKGVAVMVNRAFEDGAIFKRVSGKSLPDWAKDFDCTSWGQYFLKYALSHPAVTCVIPATANPKHMADNLAAGKGRLPDAKTRAEMVKYFESVA